MPQKCPICQSEKKEFISELCGNMSIMGSSFPACSSHNVVCMDCGCVYVDINTTQNAFDKYYNSEMSKGIAYFDLFGIKQTLDYYQHIHESIKKHVTLDSQILDMGCGLGDFPRYLMDLGYKNILAVEPSSINVQLAKEKGVSCIQDDSFSINQMLTGKFDIIILSHVHEHIFDAALAMENIKTMLKPAGIIYFEVPDAVRYCDVDFSPYFFFTYEHVIHYTKNTLSNIAKSFGLELIETDQYLKCESYYVLYGLFKNNGKFANTEYSDETKSAVQKYLDFSILNLRNFVEKLERSQEEIILWGIGASTAQLLSGTFDKCNVIQLIDSNPSRQGLKFKIGNSCLCIESPEKIVSSNSTIVVLPVMYKKSIISQIRAMGFKNKILALKD